MRKLFLVLSMAVFLCASAISVYAQMGAGQGRGMGYGAGRGAVNSANQTVTSVEEAKTAVLQKAGNLKNAVVVSATEGQGRRGTFYSVVLKDDSGKTYEYHVNPWGEVIFYK